MLTYEERDSVVERLYRYIIKELEKVLVHIILDSVFFCILFFFLEAKIIPVNIII